MNVQSVVMKHFLRTCYQGQLPSTPPGNENKYINIYRKQGCVCVSGASACACVCVRVMSIFCSLNTQCLVGFVLRVAL